MLPVGPGFLEELLVCPIGAEEASLQLVAHADRVPQIFPQLFDLQVQETVTDLLLPILVWMRTKLAHSFCQGDPQRGREPPQGLLLFYSLGEEQIDRLS